MKECYYFHKIISSEQDLQRMLDRLKERKELDITFTSGEGEDGSAFDSFIFVP